MKSKSIRDSLEQIIIDELSSNGRVPVADIARRHGIAPKRIRPVLKELLESQRIWVTPILDPALMGYKSAALMELELTGARSSAKVMENLASIPESDYVAATSGPIQIFLNMISKSPEALARLIDEKVRSVEGIRVVSTAPYLRFPYQKTGRTSRYSTNGNYRLDEFDKALIQTLAGDGRLSNSEIARRIGVSESHVRGRLNRLSKKGVLHVGAIVKAPSVEDEPRALMKLKSTRVEYDVVKLLTSLPTVTFLAEVMSEYDYIVELTCGNLDELTESIVAVREMNGVDVISSHLCYEEHRKPMLPS